MLKQPKILTVAVHSFTLALPPCRSGPLTGKPQQAAAPASAVA